MNAFLVALVLASCTAPAEPWLVANEERIRERFDPVCAQERLARFHGHTSHGWLVIEGKTDAHLFLPWELMNNFLMDTDPSRGEFARLMYRKSIERSGWHYAEFWKTIDDSSLDFRALSKSLRDDQLRTRGNVAEDDPRRDALCCARAAALTAARSAFGRMAFDRFLYQSVGRTLVFAFDPVANNRDTLLRVEAGCP